MMNNYANACGWICNDTDDTQWAIGVVWDKLFYVTKAGHGGPL